MVNWRLVAHIVGMLLMAEAAAMLAVAAMPVSMGEADLDAFVLSAALTLTAGAALAVPARRAKRVAHKSEALLLLPASYAALSAFGALPYYLGPEPVGAGGALFEAISGFTTTGVSAFADVEALGRGTLLWRALTQWAGGLGVLFTLLYITPLLNQGGMLRPANDAANLTFVKMTPRHLSTTIRLALVYLFLTLAETLLLARSGLGLFDAACHALTTVSTGGFTTLNAAAGHFLPPAAQRVVLLFMLLSGINLAHTYYLLTLRFGRVTRNEEFFYLVALIALFAAITFATLLPSSATAGQALWDALFGTVSVMTGTGFVGCDTRLWPSFTVTLLMLAMLIGGSTGSTGGGIKVPRAIIVLKNIGAELRHMLHPQAVMPLRLNRRHLPPNVVSNTLVYVLVFALALVAGTVALAFFGLDFETSASAALTSLCNAGPGAGQVAFPNSYAAFPAGARAVLCLLMLVGRLEIFALLTILSPKFWRG